MTDEERNKLIEEIQNNLVEAWDTEYKLYFDRLVYGLSIHKMVNGKKIRLDPTTHYERDGIIFCQDPKKCDSCTEPIQLEPNNILK